MDNISDSSSAIIVLKDDFTEVNVLLPCRKLLENRQCMEPDLL